MRKLFFSVLFFIATSCSSPATNDNLPVANTNQSDTSIIKHYSFFPVTSFIKGQLLTIDSLPVTPLHTITVDGKTDSVWIKKNQLANLLSTFISPEIKETNLTSFFKETSFKDQTINAITFTYDPIVALPDSISLRHWDIYIDPETGKIYKIYLVKQMKANNVITTQQLTWKTNKWASINTLQNQPNGNSNLVKSEKFIWNFSE